MTLQNLVNLASLAVILAASFVSSGQTLRSPLLSSTFDRNATDVKVLFLTPHKEVVHGQPINLKCQVEMLGAGDDSSSDDESSSSSSAAAFVDWVFMSGESDAVMEILAAKGVATLPNGRWTSLVKRSYNFVDESDIEEHYLDLEAATGHDEGVYICRVLVPANDVTRTSSSGPLAIASRHTLVSVVPARSRSETSGTAVGGGRSRQHLRRQPLAGGVVSSSLSSSSSEPATLGTVTERFVVAKRGMDVVLECRDADSDTWVYWTKHGDPSVNVTGRHLRLFRVDRWDSGMYICSTNSSENPHYNVTVRVDSPPNVTAPRHGDKNGGELIARQVVGSPAILRCKVEALPAPSLSWYHVLPSSTNATEGENDIVRRLHSGDDYTISIDSFRDGGQESSLHISTVSKANFRGSYRCMAKNSHGQDSVDIVLKESDEMVDFSKVDWTFVEHRSSAAAGSSVNQRISVIVANILAVLVVGMTL